MGDADTASTHPIELLTLKHKPSVPVQAGDQAKLQEVLHGMADLHDDAVVSFGDVE